MIDRDTIVAPATPSGEGGIGIIRLSGPTAEEFLGTFFHASDGSRSLPSHRLTHGKFFSRDGALVDEVMAVIMRAPRSYTREDVVEVHCHGGAVVMRRILDLFLGAGVRLAKPGEFTLRAFLNGRIDLARAEAVIDLIRARSDAASQVALQQMEGSLSRVIFQFRERIANLLAVVETQVDFADEDIDHADLNLIGENIDTLLAEIDKLLATFDAGRTLREGISVLIFGKPNVGKSSLLNALLGEERAIVTDLAGTTRDTIEESLTLGSFPLRLIDTAGIRFSDNPVEQEGVRRAREKVASSDLILLVVDGSAPLEREDVLAYEACRGARLLLVVNKKDLAQISLIPPFRDLPTVAISTHTGEGLEKLGDEIAATFSVGGGTDHRESILISDRRHRQALLHVHAALGRFKSGLMEAVSPEFLAIELRDCLQALGEITGETTPDDILNRIFSQFCIGK